jgi:malate synthase
MIRSERLAPAPLALHLIGVLHRELRPGWAECRAQLLSPSVISQCADYQVQPVPAELRGRRAELIVEASDTLAIRAALDSGAHALVLDLDDTFSPTRANVCAAYRAAPELVREIAARGQVLLMRPRALYASELHVESPDIDTARPAIASLCDLAVVLSARPGQPIPVYIPKLETVTQARFWDDALSLIERELGWPRFAVPVCLQIETWSGLLGADELLYTLRHRAYGLNAGRWDYVFSLIKMLGREPVRRSVPVPTRADLSMDHDSMRAYAEVLVRLAGRRGAEAIGGSAALAPDPADPLPALRRVEADKRREAAQGFTAAWAGLPVLLEAVEAGLNGVTSEPLEAEPPARTLVRLLALPEVGTLPLATVQDTIGLALDVIAAWYAGRGVIVRRGSIEDTATAELARAQLWQWVRCRAVLTTGEVFSPERYLSERGAQRPSHVPESRLLDALVLSDDCPAYFPRFAQELEARQEQP